MTDTICSLYSVWMLFLLFYSTMRKHIKHKYIECALSHCLVSWFLLDDFVIIADRLLWAKQA